MLIAAGNSFPLRVLTIVNINNVDVTGNERWELDVYINIRQTFLRIIPSAYLPTNRLIISLLTYLCQHHHHHQKSVNIFLENPFFIYSPRRIIEFQDGNLNYNFFSYVSSKSRTIQFCYKTIFINLSLFDQSRCS